MRKIELKDRKIDLKKFQERGFKKEEDSLSLRVPLPSFPFTAIYHLKKEELNCQLIDDSLKEEYELVDISNSNGYAKKVNEEYEKVTSDILSMCTIKIKTQKERIIEYTTDHYKDELEHLWEKFPDDSIIRKKENKKWYCLFMRVEAEKLGLKEKKIYDVIDLRGSEAKISSIDNLIFFLGYHMNKKHWYTLILDDRLKDEEIFSLIEESHSLAK